MANYSGSKCISCGEIFTDSDDVVVCPECGTPYHRECYFKEGKCINVQLHETGTSWNDLEQAQKTDENNDSQKESEENQEYSSAGVRCIRCGYENDSDKLFCEKCGTPLMKNPQQSTPFNTMDNPNNNANDGQNIFNEAFQNRRDTPPVIGGQQIFDKDTKIEGIKIADYVQYVGPNPASIVSSFIKFGKYGGKVSLNVFAFIFPEVYFLYRKMNPWGIIALIASSILAIPSAIQYFSSGMMGITINTGIDVASNAFIVIYNIAWYISFAIKIFSGLFANFIYYKQAKRDIFEIRFANINEEDEIKMEIATKGGVSWVSVIIGFTVESIIMFGAVAILGKLAS